MTNGTLKYYFLLSEILPDQIITGLITSDK